jgi:hypothetical protein
VRARTVPPHRRTLVDEGTETSRESMQRQLRAAGVAEARHRLGQEAGLTQRPTTAFTDAEGALGDPGQRCLDLLDLLPRAVGFHRRGRVTEKPLPEPEETNADDALEGCHGDHWIPG